MGLHNIALLAFATIGIGAVAYVIYQVATFHRDYQRRYPPPCSTCGHRQLPQSRGAGVCPNCDF